MSHRDLCERLERGLANDHQQALAKMLSLKKRKIQGVMRGTDVSTYIQSQKNITQKHQTHKTFKKKTIILWVANFINPFASNF